MKCPNPLTRSIAIATLIFVNFLVLNAQTELPAGTKIPVRMDNGISSGSAGVDDTFTAVVTKPVVIDGNPVLSAGSTFSGRVVSVKQAEGGSKPGKLEVEFDSLRLPNGIERRVSGVLADKLSKKHNRVFSALAVIGGAAVGGIVGLVTKVKNGAAIGAVVGAGAGTGIALSKKGKEVGIDSNEEFEIELTKAVMVPTDGY